MRNMAENDVMQYLKLDLSGMIYSFPRIYNERRGYEIVRSFEIWRFRFNTSRLFANFMYLCI